MLRFSAAAARRLPGLLLLGLLALLLWGQCALLFPELYGPPGLSGRVASTDSLRTAPPATLYLTLTLHNNLRRPVVVREATGALEFGGRRFPFALPARLRATTLLPKTVWRGAVAVPLRLSPDSLRILQASLRRAPQAATGTLLRWQATYSLPGRTGTRQQAWTTWYLPVLGQATQR